MNRQRKSIVPRQHKPKPAAGAPDQEKRCAYFIDRFRNLGSSTSRWGLLFFVALLYTWIVSIYPKNALIKGYITTKDKEAYFDKLIAKEAKKRTKTLNALRDSSRIFSDSTKDSSIQPKRREEFATRKRKADSLFSLIKLPAPRKRALRDSLRTAISSKDALVKRSIMDTLRNSHYKPNITIAAAEIQKAEKRSVKDSLDNKAAVVFNVPSLTSMSLGFRNGLLVWMTLVIVFLLYFFTVRLKLVQYLKDIYQCKKNDLLPPDEFGKLDMQVPFWFAPVQFTSHDEKTAYKNLVGWRFDWLQTLLCIALICFVLILQLNVAWISWHLNSAAIFEESTGYKLLTLLLLSVSFFLALLWLQPVTFTETFTREHQFSFQRREHIKTGISAALFFLLVPTIGKAVPLIKGDALHYTRRRKTSTRPGKSKAENGYYVHKRNDLEVLHYYAGGKTFAHRTMKGEKLDAFEKNLKPANLMAYINRNDTSRIRIANWRFVLEQEAYKHLNKDKTATTNEDLKNGVTVLVFALNYANSFSKEHGNRLRNLLTGVLIRFEERFDHPELALLKGNALDAIERVRFWDRTWHTPNRQNNQYWHMENLTHSYRNKWKNSVRLPWQLPKT